ncbi:MAG: hypothetical protein NTV57_08425 [Cyanobacteria bacterium]|nr:hypothetical protein [Cyanobacteriota bacterium]
MLLIELMRWFPIRRDSARSRQWVAPAEMVGAAEATILLNQRAPHELYQPGRQVGWAAEIEQSLGQGLQLLQRQSVDAGGGGLAEGSTAAVEQAQGDGSRFSGPATGLALCFTFLPASCLPFLPSSIQQVLGGAGVEELVGGNACDHHDLLGGECGKPFKQHSDNGGK